MSPPPETHLAFRVEGDAADALVANRAAAVASLAGPVVLAAVEVLPCASSERLH